ncbi:MAG: hypothetical protein R3E12_07005 [Candidatus Eisenbacteria bacterium]|uniref:Lipoprotein n=1 Tax=Eiseniibacteriota bacterium TaxID=2212470 RepID=A0A956LZV0_UNCEI|nr:hypothetical protein [Candidatus Eisenbacteria bacterium]
MLFKFQRFRIFAGASVAALLLVLSGCASDHSAPTTPSAGRDQPAWAYPMGTPDAGSDGTELGALDLLSRVIQSVVEVVLPTESAVIESGIYRLEIPAGALPDPTTYSMQYRDRGPVEVELGPHGSVFDVPVQLSIDLSGSTLASGSDVSLYWWDEDHGQWVDVGGTWDPATSTLTASLAHFSRYRPGRAGW